MTKSFRCRLVTPDAVVLDDDLVYASIPAWDGSLGVLPGRAAIVAKLGMGELRLDFADSSKGAGGSRAYLVEDGFVQMVGDKLTILANKATAAEAISPGEARAELSALEAKAPASGAAADLERLTKDRNRARAKVRMAAGAGKGI